MGNPCSPDPDIAGIGVVLSFEIAALFTIVVSCISAKRIVKLPSDKTSGFYNSLLLSLSTNQVLTGIALLEAEARQHKHGFQGSILETDPYYRLAACMMFVNAFSGYVCTLALALNASIEDARQAKARIVSFYLLIITYVAILIRGLVYQYSDEYVISVVISVVSALCTLFIVERWWKQKGTSPLLYYIGIIGGSLLATVGIIFTFVLRFADWGNHIPGCQLNTPVNNAVGFGQSTAIVLELYIVFGFIDAILENPDDDVSLWLLGYLPFDLKEETNVGPPQSSV